MDNTNDEESLKKSHSKASNAKLTLLCILTAIAFAVLWVGLGLIGLADYKTLGIVLTAVGGAVSALGLVGFALFRR